MQKQRILLMTLVALTWSLVGVSTINAQTVQDSAICIGYDTDLQPRGVGNTIFPYTDKIGLWAKIQNPTEVPYRVVWEDPNGAQYRNVPVTVTPRIGENWGIVFDSINIADSTAKNKLGVWTVYLYIEGEIKVQSQFQLINYETIIDSMTELQGRIQDIIDEKDILSEQNMALEASLEALQADYVALQAQVGTSSDYENLQDNYNDIVDEYENLKARQGTTQTMLYVSIVVALVAVAVGVYFGFMKK